MLTEAEIIARVEVRSQFNTPAKGGPNPSRISVERYGGHSSYVKDGRRYWGFETTRGRNVFASDYAIHSVVLVPPRRRP